MVNERRIQLYARMTLFIGDWDSKEPTVPRDCDGIVDREKRRGISFVSMNKVRQLFDSDESHLPSVIAGHTFSDSLSLGDKDAAVEKQIAISKGDYFFHKMALGIIGQSFLVVRDSQQSDSTESKE